MTSASTICTVRTGLTFGTRVDMQEKVALTLYAMQVTEGQHLRESGTLVRGAHIITSATPEVITDGAVRIVGEMIDDVGTWVELSTRYPGDSVTGGPHDIVTPGFVNTHGHFSEALVAGIAEQYTLWEWIQNVILAINPVLNHEMAYVGTLLSSMQMLRSGITTANDMFVCAPVNGPITPGVVAALDEIGLRGVVSFGASDLGPASIPMVMDEHAALLEAARASRLCRFRVGVAALGSQTDEMFLNTTDLAVNGGHGVHIHLQEIRDEVTATRNLHGVTPIAHCERVGTFNAPTLAAHCVWVDAADRDILAANGVGVAHNPVANMILASGVCPVPELRRLGIDVGMGVDGPASNDSQNYLETMKSAVLLQRIEHLEATALGARDVLRMATIEGAAALELDHIVGSIETGKQADLVVFDGDAPALVNVHDPFQKIAYCSSPTDVKQVWVAGERSVDDGEITNVDQTEVVARSRELARSLVAGAGLSDLSLLAR